MSSIFSAKTSQIKSNLPRPEDLSKALYTLDSGQNDLQFWLESMRKKQVKASIPNIIDHLALAIKVTSSHRVPQYESWALIDIFITLELGRGLKGIL